MVKQEKYIAAEMQLIALLGYSSPVLGKQTQKIHAKTNSAKPVMKEFPQWGRDGNACVSLIAEHNLSVSCDDKAATANYDTALPDGAGAVTEMAEDHPDKDAALRLAVLRAVILKFERQQKKA